MFKCLFSGHDWRTEDYWIAKVPVEMRKRTGKNYNAAFVVQYECKKCGKKDHNSVSYWDKDSDIGSEIFYRTPKKFEE